MSVKDHATELDLNQFTYNGKPPKNFKQKRNIIKFLAICFGGWLKIIAGLHEILSLNKAAGREFTGYGNYS